MLAVKKICQLLMQGNLVALICNTLVFFFFEKICNTLVGRGGTIFEIAHGVALSDEPQILVWSECYFSPFFSITLHCH